MLIGSHRSTQVLDFCAEDPIERVFLEDVARRGSGASARVAGRAGARRALPLRRERRPLRRGCAAFAGEPAARRRG